MTPKISLLCAAYNAENYLREMITSVLNQSFQDFEFLIYDDASTDNTAAIVRSFDDARITLCIASTNRGQNACLHELMTERPVENMWDGLTPMMPLMCRRLNLATEFSIIIRNMD